MFRIAALFLLIVVSIAHAEPPSPFGEPVNGLQLGLTVNRTTFAPGEELLVYGAFRSVTDGLLAVPGFGATWPRGMLHIRTPDGLVYVCEPAVRGATRLRAEQIQAGQLSDLTYLQFRFSRSSNPWWQPVNETNTKPIDMSQPGRYEVWMEHSAEPAEQLGSSGWSGKVRSPVITLTMRPVPVEQRKMMPTAEQLADIHAMYEVPNRKEMDVHNVRSARLRLAAARTENEGLALELAKRFIADWDTGGTNANIALFVALSDRAGYKYAEPGIDGPYLKLLAYAVVDRLDKQLEDKVPQAVRNRHAWRGPIESLHFATLYAYHHPEDAELVDRLAPKLRGLLDGKRNPEPIWQAMIDAKVLHDGMTVEKAIELLGTPRHQNDAGIDWYHSTPRHVNPGLRGRIEDGKIIDWQMYTG